MAVDKLKVALQAVDWNANVISFLNDDAVTAAVAKASLRTAIWSKQFETVDKGNPALCFVREMQIASQNVIILMGLSLYKPAASSMRSMFETALYFTYFRTHLTELETLVRDPSYFVDKKELVEFHKKHTPDFSLTQTKLGLVTRLDDWYSKVSSVVHGQFPGAWAAHKSIKEIAPNAQIKDEAVATYLAGEDIVHRLFLCSVGRSLWDHFANSAKRSLLSGLPGDARAILGLDSA